VSAGITTFLRPKSLERLLASFPPNLEYTVEDTGGNLSAARNKLLDNCKTKYLFLLEDDFEFTAQTQPALLRAILEHDQTIAAASGSCVPDEPGLHHNFDEFRGDLHLWRSWYKWRVTPDAIPYHPCHAISNFCLFRADYARRMRWNEALPILEHAEFFYRCWKANTHLMAYCPIVQINHYSDRPSDEYNNLRNREGADAQRAKEIGKRYTGVEVPSVKPRNFVVATVAHTGSRIISTATARLFGITHHLDDYGEPPSIRPPLREQDIREFAVALSQIPQPWVAKDPQMQHCWRELLPVFARYEPTLIVSTRCSKKILQSFRDRNESISFEDIERRQLQVAEWYHRWPWEKIEIDLDDVARFFLDFDPKRALQE
jgi:hypothetical protein